MAIKWWHTQRLEVLHSKLQNLSEKYENINQYIDVYLEENKLNSRKKGPQYHFTQYSSEK